MEIRDTDIVIVGSGVAGLVCALQLPENRRVTVITEKNPEDSNSYLAQGGISVSRGSEDRELYIQDTMKAGHWKNTREAVEILVDESIDAVKTLIDLGVEFTKEDGKYRRTREGGHSCFRIIHYQDRTGKSIMDGLIRAVKKRDNIDLLDWCHMVDIIEKHGQCAGVIAEKDGKRFAISADNTVLACGGIGGIYKSTTSFNHIRGDGIAIAVKHGVKLKDISYVQIHPTTFYEKTPGRRFLISESVRGEGAKLLNHGGERFVDELKPRDYVSEKIFEEMEKENKEYQWLDCRLEDIDFAKRFPGIYKHLEESGIDPSVDLVPVTPGQHYTMGGIEVDMMGKTSMNHLYAVGEVACTGVHGANRLASNSLLECTVFGKRCAEAIGSQMPNKAKINEEDIAVIEMDNEEKEYIIRERIDRDAAEKAE